MRYFLLTSAILFAIQAISKMAESENFGIFHLNGYRSSIQFIFISIDVENMCKLVHVIRAKCLWQAN